MPLDGSKLAECVLDHVESIASGCGTQEVILVSVTEKIKVPQKVGRPEGESAGFRALDQSGMSAAGAGQVGFPLQGTLVGEMPPAGSTWTRAIGKMYSQADKYLDRIQRRLIKKGINAKTEVLCSNNVAEAIVDYAEHCQADLIMMASHGRGGVSRWASGSVADKVFRATCVPLLLVRAPGCVPNIK